MAAILGGTGVTVIIDAWLNRRHRFDPAEPLRPFQPPSVAEEAQEWLHTNPAFHSSLEATVGAATLPAADAEHHADEDSDAHFLPKAPSAATVMQEPEEDEEVATVGTDTPTEIVGVDPALQRGPGHVATHGVTSTAMLVVLISAPLVRCLPSHRAGRGNRQDSRISELSHWDRSGIFPLQRPSGRFQRACRGAQRVGEWGPLSG